jgi:hypothetical protein
MKNMIKILVGSISLAFGGTAAAGIASAIVNSQPTVAVSENAETEHQVSVSNPLITNNNIYYAKGGSGSGFNFTKLMTWGIQKGGVNLLGNGIRFVGKKAFKAILKNFGVDVRSTEQKTIDNMQTQMESLQSNLKQGISDIKRSFIHIHNDDLMNNILEKLAAIQTPVTGKMATMIDIANKEDDANIDSKKLEEQKETFYQGLGELNFPKLDGNKLWNQVERLATSITTPYKSNKSLKLMDLYDEVYGKTESWDYMTVAPRRKFIGYVGSLVNSLAQLAIIRASYEMNKLKEDDANRHEYKVGTSAMIKAVNTLNGELKTELDKLSAIEKKHDEEHLITHRDAVVDKDGNLTYKEGRTVSTKLFAITTDDNKDNLCSFKHDGSNIVKQVTKAGQGMSSIIYANFNYTLDCTSDKDLYKAVFEDFSNYKSIVSDTNKNFTMKDYLVKAGFSCDNQEGFNKARGFFSRIDETRRDNSNIWKTEKHSDLRAYYYDFSKTNFEEVPGEISDVKEYRGSPFSSSSFTQENGDQIANYYLVFVNPDQKTLTGKITRTEMERVLGERTDGSFYKNHFKGHSKWTGGEKTPIAIK